MDVEFIPTETAPQSTFTRTPTPLRKNRLEDILNPVTDDYTPHSVMTDSRVSVEPFSSIDSDRSVAPLSMQSTRQGLFDYRTINFENIAIINARLADFLITDPYFEEEKSNELEPRKRKSVEAEEISDARDRKRRHKYPTTSDCSSLTSFNEDDRTVASETSDEGDDELVSPPMSTPSGSTSRLKPVFLSEDEPTAEEDETLSSTDANNPHTLSRTIITCRFGSCNAIINTIHSPLGYHLNEHHKPSSQDRNGDVACQWDACGVQVKWRNLRRHIMESHLGTLSKDCSGCGKMFSRSDALKRHQKHYCGGKKMPAQAGLGWEGAKLKHVVAVPSNAVSGDSDQSSSAFPPLLPPSGSGPKGSSLEPIPPTGRSVGRGRGRTPPRKARLYPSPNDPSSSYYREPSTSRELDDQKTKSSHTVLSVDPHRHYPREMARTRVTRSTSLTSSTPSAGIPYERYSSLHMEPDGPEKPVLFQWRPTVSWD